VTTIRNAIAAAGTGEPGLPRLLGLGLVAAALFSITFVLNRLMSLSGGHWVWTAALRYIDMALILTAFILGRHGLSRLLATFRFFFAGAPYWLVAGGVGFGLFYAGVCFAAGHAPGWVVAATWQSTILATPLVLWGFGQRVPVRGIAFAILIFAGILLINARELSVGIGLGTVLSGVLPVLVAAVAYPFGNQLLNRAKHGRDPERILDDPASAVLVMTLGALPVFAILLLVASPPAPTADQMAATLVIAIVAGGFATTLFLYARNLSSDPYRIAAVDATQAGEVGFALAGEMVILGAAAPDFPGAFGLLAITAGLIGFTFASGAPAKGR
jgi:drug/metabolite transporter (DMT)-like permease